MATITAISDDNTTATWAAALNSLITVHNASGQYLVAPDTSWIAPTLLNSWVNFGAPYAVAGYRKDAEGWIWLRGLIKDGTVSAATSILTLPSGYRPADQLRLPIDSNGAHGSLIVFASGSVTCAVGSNIYLSLNAVFKAA
jgi:hypothetical protein